MPGIGTEVPLFESKDGTRGTLPSWQRREMLILLLHPPGCADCDRFRAHLASKAALLSAEQVRAVEVPFGDSDLDPDRRHSAAIAQAAFEPATDPLLVVADRFARVYAALKVHGVDPEALLRSAIEWTTFIQSQCEECGAPVWT